MKARWFPVKAMVVVVVFFAMSSVMAGAAEVVFPVSAYTPEKLAKVREWKKVWAGKRIDKTNIDQVAQFMPESFAGIYKAWQRRWIDTWHKAVLYLE